MKRKRIEEYQNYLPRLFPDEYGTDKWCRSVTLQVCDGCNLACTYCYQINKHNNFMPFETAKGFIDTLLDSDASSPYVNTDNSPGIILDFIGGEPLLAIDLIAQISDYFYEQVITRQHPWARRFMFSICSNGVLYFDPKVQEYFKKHKGHLSFSVSIDGNKDLHDSCRVFPDGSGSYDIAIKAATHYRETYNHDIGTKMTLAPQNVMHTFAAVKNLIDIGYADIHLNCVYEKGWEIEHATILYQQLKQLADYLIYHELYDTIDVSIFEESLGCPMKEDDLQNWCGGTGKMIAVDYKGDIYPCLRYMESSLGDGVEPLIIGTVENGIMSEPKQREAVRCLECITRRTQSTDECFTCPIARGCAWCSAYNYQEFGTADHRATYICEMHKARVLANVYFWNKVYAKRGDNSAFKNNVPDEWSLAIITSEELDELKRLENETGTQKA